MKTVVLQPLMAEVRVQQPYRDSRWAIPPLDMSTALPQPKAVVALVFEWKRSELSGLSTLEFGWRHNRGAVPSITEANMTCQERVIG